MRSGMWKVMFAVLVLILYAVPSFALTLSGSVVNASTKTPGRVYVGLQGWPSGSAVTIAAPGAFTMRGVSDGYYQLQAFMDSNNDGAFSNTEAAGMSTVVVAGGQVVSGAPVVQLFDPMTTPTPQPASSLTAAPGNGGVLFGWRYPTDTTTGAVAAENFLVEWSTNSFATVAGSQVIPLSPLEKEEGKCVITGLGNGVTYYFRIKSRIGSQVAVSPVISGVVGVPAGGYTVSGTLNFTGFTSAAKPVYVVLWSDNDNKLYFVRYPTAASGMSFSIPGVQNGLRGFYAFVDMNDNKVPDVGDYFISKEIMIYVNGANYTGVAVPLSAEEVTLIGVSNSHSISDSQHQYMLWSESEGFRKRPVNCSVTGPQIGTRDVNIFGEVAWNLPSRPNVGDAYTFTITFLDGSVKSYTRTVAAVYDDPATSIAPSGSITSAPTAVTWVRPAGFPTNGIAMAGIYNENYEWDSVLVPSSVTSVPFTGSPLQTGQQYSTVVQLCDSNWNCVRQSAGFTFTSTQVAATPASLSVPATDADGAYTVSWGASATAGVTYQLQEATNSSFTTGLRAAYSGTALSAAITGRPLGAVYYYRVRALKTGYTSSTYRNAANGCAVPGTAAGTPASITVPVADSDGAYTVSWGASATAGVTYQLQEATNSSFTTGLRTAYSGTGLSAAITGRPLGAVYYYRVRAVKTGYTSSTYRNAANGCAVPGTTAATPSSISVPAADSDGAYTVTWGASATPGVTYQLQEATNSAFTSGLRTINAGGVSYAAITGRPPYFTYYYRVRAVKNGYTPSAYRTGAAGCAVPGAAAATPASITVPISDLDGSYTVIWGGSATSGVSYQLQEATNSSFSAGLRTINTGTALSTAITGRSPNLTYFYRVRAMRAGYLPSPFRTGANGCAVPGTEAAIPGGVSVPIADTDGIYTVTWGASATAGVSYQLQEATNSAFTAGTRIAYSGTALSVPITGRSQNVTYYYRVLAMKPGLLNSAYRPANNGCAVPGTDIVATPYSLTVPFADTDGSYSVSWSASVTAGVTYVLQEATNSLFTAGLRTVYTGSALSCTITGRIQNVTYFYRVQAIKPGMRNSAYRTGSNGCAVPGSATVQMPTSISVPSADADGAYTVSWGGSGTAGVTYLLQEATNSSFTTGLRTAYTGTSLSAVISGRLQNTTYFYRVLATKPGLRNSYFREGTVGCAVPGSATVAIPGAMSVPATDADGSYLVSWGTSATAGVTYRLQEATDLGFATGLRTAYTGTAASVNITGRTAGTTYYYRVMATKPGMLNSPVRTASNGCAVP